MFSHKEFGNWSLKASTTRLYHTRAAGKMQIDVYIYFSVTWQLPVSPSLAKLGFLRLIWLLMPHFPWRHPGAPCCNHPADVAIKQMFLQCVPLFICSFLTSGNTQNLPAKARGAHQPADDMQQCHQQAKEMSARPTLQHEQVRNSSLTLCMEWEKPSGHWKD